MILKFVWEIQLIGILDKPFNWDIRNAPTHEELL
jgi:hypothetical protein